MREVHHGRRAVLLATVAMLTSGVPSAAAAGPVPNPPSPDIRTCSRIPELRYRPPGTGRPPARPTTAGAEWVGGAGYSWTAEIDDSGWLRGHTLSLGAAGVWRAGPRAFADGPFGDTLVVGERSTGGTRMRLVDLTRGCSSRVVTVRSLVYGSVLLDDGTLAMSLVDPRTRAESGIWQIGPAGTDRPRRIIAPPVGQQATAVPREVSIRRTAGGILARWCAAGRCVARGRSGFVSGHSALVDLDPEAESDGTNGLPLRSPRPVPVYDRWFPWSVLSYRFHGSETPPSWMRQAVKDAADDATDTSRSLSPIFHQVESGGQGVIRYTSSFPSGCANAIACASHDADQWTLRMRPQGYDFRWGELRWCQKTNGDGCFDAERVALHEFGHVVGLDHPEAAGFRLPPSFSVMHQVTPSRPRASWDRHGFASCDVASLQEQYGTPTMGTRIAACNDVDARVSLSASATSIPAGSKLVLSATLKVRSDAAEYGELSGMRLNERSVQLRRRAAGSTGGWITSWMRWAEAPGLYTITLYPRATYEYVAVFPTPDEEGLRGDSSAEVTVRVSGTCNGGCPVGEDET